MWMRFLLLDDEADILEYLQIILEERFGSECLSFGNGADGLKAALDEPYDLIITDHLMPELTGGELVIEIRKQTGPNQQTPIIVLSGYINEDLKEMLPTDKVDLLTKPMIEAEFLDLIATRLP